MLYSEYWSSHWNIDNHESILLVVLLNVIKTSLFIKGFERCPFAVCPRHAKFLHSSKPTSSKPANRPRLLGSESCQNMDQALVHTPVPGTRSTL
jgi:hypothetical protein